MTRFNSRLRGLSLCAFLGATAATYSQDSESDWTRHFRIGGSFMLGVSSEFRTRGTFAVNRPPPSAAGGISYDDGFVGVDSTGNAIPQGGTQPVTTFWGYNDASQYNAAANRLTMHGSQSFDADAFDKISDNPVGFDMVYAATFRKWEHVEIGGEFGFGFNIFQTRDHRPMAATLTRVVDQYDTSGIPSAVFPTAPYSGPQNAEPTTQGSSAPVLPATPVSSSTEVVQGTIGGVRSLEGILYNFRLGPQVRWEFYPRWTLNGSAGAALGIFDAVYRYNEIIAASAGSSVSNKGHFGTTDLKIGGYASAVFMFDTRNNWEPFLGAHFMTLPDGHLSRDGREATMRLGSAVYITAGINWSY